MANPKAVLSLLAPPLPTMPVPTKVDFGDLRGPDGKRYVLMQVSTPSGTHVFYLPEEVAATARDALAQATIGVHAPRIVTT